MPTDRATQDWKSRLDAEFEKLRQAGNYNEVTYNRLKSLVKAPSDRLLLNAVTERILDGKVHVFYRVLSPRNRAPVAKFPSLLDVPESILDTSTGDYIAVDPFRNVETVYTAEARVGN